MARFYCTTPIYYINDAPHIGHSYTTTACDALTRLHRLFGDDCFFLTGTDENAPKVEEAAAKRGVSVQEHVDELAELYREMWRKLHVAYDGFIRTTEPRHRRVVHEVVGKIMAAGDIYKGPYEALYCMSCETYWSMSESPDELCANDWCRKPLTKVKEETYFFRLSVFGDRLLEAIEGGKLRLMPEFRKNEVVRFIQDGLRDVSISRKNTGWGIPFPGDESQVIYVWFDALINYYTATVEPGPGENRKPAWPATLHLMSKDIFTRFHTTLWPAMLMSAGLELPEVVFAHGFWNIEGQKFSKSLGNAIDPLALAQRLSDLAGCDYEVAIDAIRYLLLREVKFGQDGDFSFRALCRRFNADLANDLGNLLNRTLAMVHKYFDGGRVPQHQLNTMVQARVQGVGKAAKFSLENVALDEILEECWELLADLNQFIDREAPWKRHKVGDLEGTAEILGSVLCGLRAVSAVFFAFCPEVAREMRRQMGIVVEPCLADLEDPRPPAGGWVTAEPSPIFPRIPAEALESLAEKPQVSTADGGSPSKQGGGIEVMSDEQGERREQGTSKTYDSRPPEAAEVVEYAEFRKAWLRTAKVLACERVPKTDKLLQLTIDVGDEQRTIVAGIGAKYTPEELVGQEIVVVANLAPAKIRGIESKGMLLAASAPDDSEISLLTPLRPVPPGSLVK